MNFDSVFCLGSAEAFLSPCIHTNRNNPPLTLLMKRGKIQLLLLLDLLCCDANVLLLQVFDFHLGSKGLGLPFGGSLWREI